MRTVCGLIVMSLLLAACGGGGGSTPPTTTGGQTGGSTGGNSGGLTSTSVERSDAQSALVGVQAYENAEGGGSGGILTARRMLEHVDVKAMLAHERRDVPTCEAGSTGGTEETVVETSSTTETVTIETFYDAACTEPEVDLVWNASLSGTNLTGPATYTQYNATGTTAFTASAQVTIYATSTGTETGISLLITGITGADTGSLVSTGLACSETGSAGCSLAVVGNTSSGETGVVSDASVSTTAVSMQVQAYQGSAGALSIQAGTFPDWTIAPSSDEIASVSISGGPASGGGFSLTLTDNVNGGTFAITGSANGTVTGTLTATGSSTTDASFSIDAAGDGTLTYGNGTTASIVDFEIQS
jgi:hypothetical protein